MISDSETSDLQSLLEEIKQKTLMLTEETKDIEKIDRGTQIDEKQSSEIATPTEEGHKETQSEACTSKGTEEETNIPEITIPIYGPVVNPEAAFWEISEPIFLLGSDQSKLSISREGLYLERGFYKIEYTFINIHPGTGLALFESDSKRFIKLLAYLSYSGATSNTALSLGKDKAYFEVKKVQVLGITNSKLEYRPKTIKGTIVVTIHRLKLTPK